MFQFIIVLRALSAIIITNAHYEQIYPYSILANGGLLGDVLFFAISGFCLYMPKGNFLEWYKRRLTRIFPKVWLITFLYTVLGYYRFGNLSNLFSSFIYPTHYHFIGSIIVLYIFFYLICYIQEKVHLDHKKYLKIVFFLVFAIQLVLYVSIFDKSTYHIDSVYEPMIRLLFLEAMIIGAIFRSDAKQYTKYKKPYMAFVSIVLFLCYIVSKLAFSRYALIAPLQIFNQYIILVLLFCIFAYTASFESAIHRIPGPVFKVITFISNITLEIYLVQYALIYWMNIGPFPINFLLVSASIFVCAWILHIVGERLLYRSH